MKLLKLLQIVKLKEPPHVQQRKPKLSLAQTRMETTVLEPTEYNALRSVLDLYLTAAGMSAYLTPVKAM
jgi:hypothetical protein